MKRLNNKFVIILSLAFSLQGCFVAGAAVGAAAITVVYDHRTFHDTLHDTKLANNIAEKIRQVPALRDDSHINVTVFNSVVLLTGETTSTDSRQQAEEIAKTEPNIGRVYNQVTIQGPTSSLTRTSDSWITTKIKSQLLAEENLHTSSIKVVTENGVVFLMGSVTQAQADSAVNIAREVSGVQKVVKVFQYKVKDGS